MKSFRRQEKDGVTMRLGYLHYVCGIVVSSPDSYSDTIFIARYNREYPEERYSSDGRNPSGNNSVASHY